MFIKRNIATKVHSESSCLSIVHVYAEKRRTPNEKNVGKTGCFKIENTWHIYITPHTAARLSAYKPPRLNKKEDRNNWGRRPMACKNRRKAEQLRSEGGDGYTENYDNNNAIQLPKEPPKSRLNNLT